MRLVSSLCFAATVFSAAAALAQNPFVGNWKLSTAAVKSMEQHEFLTCTPAANAAITCTDTGPDTYTFTPNGTKYLSHNPYNSQVTSSGLCRKLDEHTLNCTVIMAGVPPGRRTWKLSGDGNTLLYDDVLWIPGIVRKMASHNDYARDTPGTGFVGSWKHTYTMEGLLHWTPFGPNGLHMEAPELHTVIDLPFDGKEHHPAGPIGPYMSSSATRTGPNSFSVVNKVMGKVLPPTDYRVSADGQTMTATAKGKNGAPQALTYVRVP